MNKPPNFQVVSVKGLLDWAIDSIKEQSELRFQAPSLEARLLFSHVTGNSHAWQMSYANEKLHKHMSQTQIAQFVDLVEQRLRGKPIAFILGTQDFWSLTLKVNDCTLIPRQDTEILVETVLALNVPSCALVLDLGTGTGAIALALAKEKSDWQITGLDKIQAAVELATENARLNELNVRFLQSNWFSALHTQGVYEKFDVIVTNPPYVEEDSEYVKQGDLRYEPLCALVSGKDGLDDIRHIITQARSYLSSDSYLIIEHGHTQHKNVQALLCDAGFTDVKSIDDLNQIPRITMGQWTQNHAGMLAC